MSTETTEKAMKRQNEPEIESEIKIPPQSRKINPIKYSLVQLTVNNLDSNLVKRRTARILSFKGYQFDDGNDPLAEMQKQLVLNFKSQSKVQKLSLRDVNITGLKIIPSILKKRTCFRDLDFRVFKDPNTRYAHLKHFWEYLQGMSSLESLTLNEINNQKLFFLPKSLQKLPSLKAISLDLSLPKRYKLKEIEARRLKNNLKRLTGLKSLQLSGICDEAMNIFKETLNKFTFLKQITLNFGVFLEDNILTELQEILQKMTDLQVVFVKFKQSNGITDVGLSHLRDGLHNHTSLKHLSFSFSDCEKITDVGVGYLSEGFQKIDSLKSLDLGFQGCGKITDIGLIHLKESFQKCAPLQSISLNFSANGVTNAGLGHLKDGLQSLTSLEQLDLKFRSCSKITNAGLGNFTDGLQSLTSLEQLDLNFSRCSKITNAGLNHLKEYFQAHSSLKHLSLNFQGCKKVTDNGLILLKEALQPLTCLERLSLNFGGGIFVHEKITSQGMNHLKECFQMLSSLRDLSVHFLSCKKITDKDIIILKESVQGLTCLRSVNFEFSRTKVTSAGLLDLKNSLQKLPYLRYAPIKADYPYLSTESVRRE